MRKRSAETGVLFNKTPRSIRTSELGDTSLSLLQRATKAEPLEDREGLQRAYQQGDSYTRGDTMYVAGSHTARDWYDNFTKIPFWGDLRGSHRYKQADKMLNANPQVRNLAGHSLGGAVVHELQKTPWTEERDVRRALRVLTWGGRGAVQKQIRPR